jgi:hypothetical protein
MKSLMMSRLRKRARKVEWFKLETNPPTTHYFTTTAKFEIIFQNVTSVPFSPKTTVSKSQATTASTPQTITTLRTAASESKDTGNTHQIVFLVFLFLLLLTSFVLYVMFRRNSFGGSQSGYRRRRKGRSKGHSESRSIPKLELDTSPNVVEANQMKQLSHAPVSHAAHNSGKLKVSAPSPVSASVMSATTIEPETLVRIPSITQPSITSVSQSSTGKSPSIIPSESLTTAPTEKSTTNFEYKSSPFEPQFKPIIQPKTLSKNQTKLSTSLRSASTDAPSSSLFRKSDV